MPFKVGKLGGIFDEIGKARDFTVRQLDTVMDVTGTVRDTASSAKSTISGGSKSEDASEPEAGAKSFLQSVPPIAWVGIAGALAYLFFGGKKR